MQELIDRLDRIEALLAQPPKEYVNNAEAAAFLGLQAKTLELWRTRAEGPIYVKVGKLVMYSMVDLRAFMEARKKAPLA